MENIKKRFLTRVPVLPESECWEWKGSFFKGRRYGVFYWGNIGGKEKTVQAHRAAWMLFRSEIPKGAMICRRCNNPPCVNPAHLYIGNAITNAADRDEAGTTSRWDKRYNFKRNSELVETVKRAVQSGLTFAQIKEVLGIGWQTIYRLRNQDAELKKIMAETKSDRYSAAAKRRMQ